MSKFFAGTFQQGNFNYMRLIRNDDRLPLFIGMSCLNGLYWEPRLISLAEEMTNKVNGGAIAYISASSLAFTFVNNFINLSMFRSMFEDRVLQFGQGLTRGKVEMLTQFPHIRVSGLVMNLTGDPAQEIAIPSGPDLTFPESGGLTLTGREELTTQDSIRVEVRINNLGIIPDTEIEVLLVDRNIDQSSTDTHSHWLS